MRHINAMLGGWEAGMLECLEAGKLECWDAWRLKGWEVRMLGGDIWKVNQVNKLPSFLALWLTRFPAFWPPGLPAIHSLMLF